MTIKPSLFAAATALLFSSVAVADVGSWFANKTLAPTEPVPGAWGAKKGRGWASLGNNVVAVTSNAAAFPVCLTPGNTPWVGVARANASGGIYCLAYNGSNDGGTVFSPIAGRPSPMWISSNSSTPEPNGAVVLAKQTSGRLLMACQTSSSGITNVGYIGDDGKCYTINDQGDRAIADSYLVLVTKGTGVDAQPAYGWVPAASGYNRHGNLASTTAPNASGQWVNQVLSCRVKENFTYWPGWIKNGQCDYFTYVNGQTVKKVSSSYEVHRLKPGASVSPYVFNRSGGTSFYACTAKIEVNGATKKFMLGFTNNPNGCTDGEYATDQPYHFGSLRLGWSSPTLLALNADPERG